MRINAIVQLYGGSDWTSTDVSAHNVKDGFLGTRTQAYLEIRATNIEIQLDELKSGTQYIRRIVGRTGDVEIHDHIPTSDVNVLMCYDKDKPRESESCMFAVQMEVSHVIFFPIVFVSLTAPHR